jgi:hypothetical protein
MSWPRLVVGALVVLIGGAIAAGAIGSWRWRIASDDLIAELFRPLRASPAFRYDARDVEHLPPPVVRYFHHVLRDGQPLIRRVRIAHEGSFNASSGAEKWAPFRSVETFTVNPPGFVWDARIRMMPLVPALVRDAYVAGRGQMRARLLNLIPLAEAGATPQMAAGALQRYLAEAPWFPTALLPVSGVEWAPVDDRRARATLRDGATTVTLEFRFSERDEISEVYTPARFRQVGKEAMATPWSGVHGDYMRWDGMRIPTVAEVRWHLPDRVLPYWRGRVIDVEYEYEPTEDAAVR